MKLQKVIFAFLVLAFGSTALASWKEGKHYQRAPTAIAKNDLIASLLKEADGKVQVLEFFSYGCHWCYRLDPKISAWAKTAPKEVEFQRIPVEFQPSWRPLTKAYFTAEALDAIDTVHKPMFEAIQNEVITNSGPDVLKNFFVTKGIDGKKFDSTFKSFAISNKQRWASSISQAYKITAIPTVVVQGSEGIFMTNTSKAGGEKQLIELVSMLVDKQIRAATS